MILLRKTIIDFENQKIFVNRSFDSNEQLPLYFKYNWNYNIVIDNQLNYESEWCESYWYSRSNENPDSLNFGNNLIDINTLSSFIVRLTIEIFDNDPNFSMKFYIIILANIKIFIKFIMSNEIFFL